MRDCGQMMRHSEVKVRCGLVPRNALALTKPPPFAHVEIDLIDCWERFGKELKVSKHRVNCTESTGHMFSVRSRNPKVARSNRAPATN